jgi:ketosteroid isomerase-like protein
MECTTRWAAANLGDERWRLRASIQTQPFRANIIAVSCGESLMHDPFTHLEKIRFYLKAIEEGSFDPLLDLFAPDAVLEQLPNRIYPKGIRSGTSAMRNAFEKGRQLLSSQTYEIKNYVVLHDRIAVEVLWRGKLAINFGTLSVGSEMIAYSAMFFEFREGKIISQRNYDCFEPW